MIISLSDKTWYWGWENDQLIIVYNSPRITEMYPNGFIRQGKEPPRKSPELFQQLKEHCMKILLDTYNEHHDTIIDYFKDSYSAMLNNHSVNEFDISFKSIRRINVSYKINRNKTSFYLIVECNKFTKKVIRTYLRCGFIQVDVPNFIENLKEIKDAS